MSLIHYPKTPLPVGATPQDLSGTTNLGFYLDEATQRYVPGTRGITWDGRVFKYAKSRSAALLSGYGAHNDSIAVNISVTGATVTAGDLSSVLVFASGDGVDAGGVCADGELIGGYWVTGHGASTVQNRCIEDTDGVGITGAGGNITLYFDGPVSDTLATPFTEVVLNPYRYLVRQSAADGYASVMGVPACNVTAASYCWIQSWGPCWVTPGGSDASPGDTFHDRTAIFVGDGSVNFVKNSTLENGYQIAGFCIDETASGTSALPLVMLQISI